jgi:hypothetical protein
MEPTRLDISLAAPLSYLFSLIPQLTDMPSLPSIKAAQLQLYTKTQHAFATLPAPSSSQAQLAKVAQPFVAEMREMNPHISRKLDSYLPWRISLITSICTFLFSMTIHVAFIHVSHHRVFRRLRKFAYPEETSSPPQIIIAKSKEDLDDLLKHPPMGATIYSVAEDSDKDASAPPYKQLSEDLSKISQA